MPLDLDAVRKTEDRDIIVRGETFTVQHVPPEVMDEFDKIQDDIVAKGTKVKWSELAASFDARIRLMIDDGNGSLARWDRLRADGQIDYAELREITTKCVELATALPTMPPSSSGGGPAKPAVSSVGGSA